jgi:hypothetical protein
MHYRPRTAREEDLTVDLTVKPRLNQRLLFAAATGSFDLCPPGAFFKLGSTEEQDAFLASREITEFEEPKEMLKTCTLDLANYAKKVKWSLEFFCALFGIEHHAERSQFFNFLMYLHEEFEERYPLDWIKKTYEGAWSKYRVELDTLLQRIIQDLTTANAGGKIVTTTALPSSIFN